MGTYGSERLNGNVVNHFTVIDHQPRVSMLNSLLYYCSMVKALVKSIYIAKKWISDITAPLYNLRRCYCNGVSNCPSVQKIGIRHTEISRLHLQLRSTLFCSLQTLFLSEMSSEGELQGVNNC